MWGCFHDCLYCYARKMDVRFHRETEECMLKQIFPKMPKNKLVMFPTTHDLHPKYIGRFSLTVIELINKGNRVLFTTKSSNSTFRAFLDKLDSDIKDFSNTNEMLKTQVRSNLEIRITITCRDNSFIEKFEKKTGFYEERLANLRYAYERGYKTSVSIEPLLCSKEDLDLIILDLVDRKTDSVWIGTLSSIPEDLRVEVAPFYSKENLQKIYDEYSLKLYIHIKDTFINRLRTFYPPKNHKDILSFAGGN